SHCYEHSGLFMYFTAKCGSKRRCLHSFSHTHTHARSHNYTASSWRLHNMCTLNIVESVVGCFVGLWCLFATRCEGVLVSGVYREFCVLFGLPRYISFIHNICINLCCCLIILIYTGYPLSHPFSICISITSINWLTYMYSHFLVLMLPYTGPNTKVRSRWDNTFTWCHLRRERGIRRSEERRG